MRTAPPSIVAQQKSYALGARLWTCLYVLPNFAALGFWIAMLLDRSLKQSLRPLALVILVSFISMLLLNPWGRAARCRKASDLLNGKIIRYEVGDSVSDTDLAMAAEQAAQIMQAPLPTLRKTGLSDRKA
jgi:hypothetical protein